MASTFASTGRSMKNFDIMLRIPADYFAASADRTCASTFCPGMASMMPPTTTRSSLVSPLSMTRSRVDQRTGLDLALLDDIVLVDDEHVAAALVAAERDIGHEQRRLRLRRHAHAHEKAGQQAALVVLQGAAHRQRSGRRVHSWRDVVELADVRIAFLVLQPDFDRDADEIGDGAAAAGEIWRARAAHRARWR